MSSTHCMLFSLATKLLTYTQLKVLDIFNGSLGRAIPGAGVPSPAAQPMQSGGGRTAMPKDRRRISEVSQ